MNSNRVIGVTCAMTTAVFVGFWYTSSHICSNLCCHLPFFWWSLLLRIYSQILLLCAACILCFMSSFYYSNTFLLITKYFYIVVYLRIPFPKISTEATRRLREVSDRAVDTFLHNPNNHNPEIERPHGCAKKNADSLRKLPTGSRDCIRGLTNWERLLREGSAKAPRSDRGGAVAPRGNCDGAVDMMSRHDSSSNEGPVNICISVKYGIMHSWRATMKSPEGKLYSHPIPVTSLISCDEEVLGLKER